MWVKKNSSNWVNVTKVWVKKNPTSWVAVKKIWVKNTSSIWSQFWPEAGPYPEEELSLSSSLTDYPSFGTNYPELTATVYHFDFDGSLSLKYKWSVGPAASGPWTDLSGYSTYQTYTPGNPPSGSSNTESIIPDLSEYLFGRNYFRFVIQAIDSSGTATREAVSDPVYIGGPYWEDTGRFIGFLTPGYTFKWNTGLAKFQGSSSNVGYMTIIYKSNDDGVTKEYLIGTANNPEYSFSDNTEYEFTGTESDLGYTYYATTYSVYGDLLGPIEYAKPSVTISEELTQEEYTVTWNGNGGIPSITTTTEYVGLAHPAPIVTRDGYDFFIWRSPEVGGDPYFVSEGGSFTPTGNITFYAIWTPKTYTITFDANGGINAPTSQTKTHDVALTLTSSKPTRTNFTFDGWNTSADGSGTNYSSGGSYTANEDVTLYAKWTPITYTVTWNANGGTGGTTTTQNAGTAHQSPTVSRTGYTLFRWRSPEVGGDPYFVNPGGSFTPTENITFWAIWTPDTYTVTFNANGGSGAPESQTKTHDVPLTLSSTQPTRTYFTFDGWNTASDGSGTNYSAGGLYNVNASVTLYAKWTSIDYTVTWNSNGGTPATSSTTQNAGVVHTPPVVTRTGYTFSRWRNPETGGDPVFVNAGSTYTATANITFWAQWIANTYTVSFNNNGGTGSPADQTKVHDVTLTLSSTQPTRTNFTFNGWNTSADGTGTSYSAGGSYTTNAAVTLYAQWTAIQYTVTWNANGGTGGTTTTQNAGTAHTAPTVSRTGYTFSTWRNPETGGDPILVGAGGSYTPTANITFYAIWTEIKYTITFNSQGGSAVASLTQASSGASIAQPANPTRSGFTFNGWFTATSGGTAVSWPRTPSANETLYAQWTAVVVQYTVTWNANGGTGGGSTTQNAGIAHTAPSEGTRTGFTFFRWRNPEFGGDPILIASGGSYTPTSNITFWAQWTANVVTVPGIVSSLTATSSLSGTNLNWSASWSAPSNNGGGAITGYRVYVERAGSSSGPWIASTTQIPAGSGSYTAASPYPTTSTSVSGRVTGTAATWIRVWVAAVNSAGVGTYTSAIG